MEHFSKKNPDFKNKELVEMIADYLLAEENQIPLVLKIENRTIFKNYGVEIDAMRKTLLRAGIPLLEGFQLEERKYLQGDIYRYVGNIVGLEPGREGDFFRYREAGDYYTLNLFPAEGQYWIEYIPHRGNRQGVAKKVVLTYPDIIRGVIRTYISRICCSEELAGVLPQAMTREVVKNYLLITD